MTATLIDFHTLHVLGVDPDGPDPLAHLRQGDRANDREYYDLLNSECAHRPVVDSNGAQWNCSRTRHPETWAHIAAAGRDILAVGEPEVINSDGETVLPEPVDPSQADPLAHLTIGSTVQRNTEWMTASRAQECITVGPGTPGLVGRDGPCRRRAHPPHWRHIMCNHEEVIGFAGPDAPAPTVPTEPADTASTTLKPEPWAELGLGDRIDRGHWPELWSDGAAHWCKVDVESCGGEGYGICSRPAGHPAHWRHIAADSERIVGVAPADSLAPVATGEAPSVTEPVEDEPIERGEVMKYRNRAAPLYVLGTLRDGRIEVLDLDHTDSDGLPRRSAVERRRLVHRKADATLSPEQVKQLAKYMAAKRQQTRTIGVRERREGYFKTDDQLNNVLSELALEPYRPQPSGTISISIPLTMAPDNPLVRRGDGYTTGINVLNAVREAVTRVLREHDYGHGLRVEGDITVMNGSWTER
jgi:hypothetical protein